MIKQLIKLANHLDRIGFVREANYLDNIIKSSGIGEDDEGTSEVISLESYMNSKNQRARNVNPIAKEEEEAEDRGLIYIKIDDNEELVTKEAMVALISEEEQDDIRFLDQSISPDILISVKTLIEFYMDNKK